MAAVPSILWEAADVTPLDRVVYIFPEGRGWDPITLMARLLADHMEAEYVEIPAARSTSLARRIAALGPRRRRGGRCLVVAPNPAVLNALSGWDHWSAGFSDVAAWVIDSFWTERLPRLARAGRHIERYYVTDLEVVDQWREVTGRQVDWLPWGADVVGLGSGAVDRTTDVLRVGRQTASWDDDAAVADLAAARGLVYGGRPPFVDSDPLANQRGLHRHMEQSRFVLAFNNVVAPAPYTHPRRQYLTGRWTNALASGCIVAGAAPVCAATDRLLWPGSTVEIDPHDPATGVEQLVEASAAWRPEMARYTFEMARSRLDWRLRFRELARLGDYGESTTLRRELLRVEGES